MSGVPYNENPYPARGYLYDDKARHGGGEWLRDTQELYAWLDQNLPVSLATGRELMVTDNMDDCIFHAKYGEILWPNDTMTPPNEGAPG